MDTENKSNTPLDIRDSWQTPKFVFDYYDKRFSFTGDIAASERNALCDIYIDHESDALDSAQYWFERGWVNPPYSDIAPWVKKAIEQMKYGALTVMLLPADTSVKWFKLAFDSCTECHFISGRLSFINADTKKPVSGNNKGSVVFIFDPASPVKRYVQLIDRDSMK